MINNINHSTGAKAQWYPISRLNELTGITLNTYLATINNENVNITGACGGIYFDNTHALSLIILKVDLTAGTNFAMGTCFTGGSLPTITSTGANRGNYSMIANADSPHHYISCKAVPTQTTIYSVQQRPTGCYLSGVSGDSAKVYFQLIQEDNDII